MRSTYWPIERPSFSANSSIALFVAGFLQCISGFDRHFVYIGENIFSIYNNLMADRLVA
jgi:hypothetical protein